MNKTLLKFALTIVAIASLGSASSIQRQFEDCEIAAVWAQRAVEDVNINMPPGWVLNISCDESPWLGFTESNIKTITVWPEAHTSVGGLQWTYVHEVGHAYDSETMTPSDRALWREIRGITTTVDWFGYSANSNTELSYDEWSLSPAEDFAESFAVCFTDELVDWHLPHTVEPNVRECDIIQSMTNVSTN